MKAQKRNAGKPFIGQPTVKRRPESPDNKRRCAFFIS
jgi:hypothetical protein